MTVVVRAPRAREPERRYVLGVVLGDWLGLDWRLELQDRADVAVRLQGDEPGRELMLPDVFLATPDRQWLKPASLPGRRPRRHEGLPVLFGAPDGSIDLLGGCFFLLTRYEERVVARRDEPGRFVAAGSLAHSGGYLGLPLADAYADVLWARLQRRWPRLRRRAAHYAVALSHDVGAEVPGPRDLTRRLRSWTSGMRGDRRDDDPYATCDQLMDAGERHGLRTTFYVPAPDVTAPATGRFTLDDPRTTALLRRIHERGHELGLLAGSEGPRDAAPTARELERLRAAAEREGAGQDHWGGRRRSLRWENPATWRTWERAGLAYDATLGHPDAIGFRAGTCREYRAFDLLARRAMSLTERPLHVMDTTLLEHLGLSPQDALARVAELAATVRRHGGTLSIACHGGALPSAARGRWYVELVDVVAEGAAT